MTMENPAKRMPNKTKDFDMKKFELYFRTFLICGYYAELFKKNQT